MSETNIEASVVGGDKLYSSGQSSLSKYYDLTSEAWERWSGSSAPLVNAVQSGTWNVYTSTGITGSVNLNALVGQSGSWLVNTSTGITGSVKLIADTRTAITGSEVNFNVLAGQSGSWAVSVNNNITGLVGQSGSWNVGGTTALTGSTIVLAVTGSAYSTAQVPATVNVGVGSTTVLAANANRLYSAIVNDSDTAIYLALGNTAVANRGIRINASGGSFEINSTNLFLGAINGIHTGSGNKAVCVQEAP